MGLCKVQYFRKLRFDSQSYFIWISKSNQKCWLFTVFTVINIGSQTNRWNMIILTYKELPETFIKSKKAAYIHSMYQMSQQKFSRLTVSAHLAFRYVKEVFSDMYSSSILLYKCPRTNLNLVNTNKFHKK